MIKYFSNSQLVLGILVVLVVGFIALQWNFQVKTPILKEQIGDGTYSDNLLLANIQNDADEIGIVLIGAYTSSAVGHAFPGASDPLIIDKATITFEALDGRSCTAKSISFLTSTPDDNQYVVLHLTDGTSMNFDSPTYNGITALPHAEQKFCGDSESDGYDECMKFATRLDDVVFTIEGLEDIPDDMLRDEDYEGLVWEAGKLLAQARAKVERAAAEYFINTAALITAEKEQ